MGHIGTKLSHWKPVTVYTRKNLPMPFYTWIWIHGKSVDKSHHLRVFAVGKGLFVVLILVRRQLSKIEIPKDE